MISLSCIQYLRRRHRHGESDLAYFIPLKQLVVLGRLLNAHRLFDERLE